MKRVRKAGFACSIAILLSLCGAAGAVDIEPLRAMSIITCYRFDQAGGEFAFDRTHMIEKWDVEGGQASLPGPRACTATCFTPERNLPSCQW